MADNNIYELASLYQRGLSDQLGPFSAYLAGQAASDIVLVKGICGPIELAGGPPFSGPDSAAVSAALASLGWGEDNWCGVLTQPSHQAKLSDEELRLIIEVIDPQLIIGMDQAAGISIAAALSYQGPEGLYADKGEGQANNQQAEIKFDDNKPPRAINAGEPIQYFNRQILVLSGFEAALSDDLAKQKVWAQLKTIKR
ncbi:MAG: hypothetical protein FWH40_02175 [Coriobacteriia bacterium]|nr:hypothetical protein [Coriobacteriia bacterium]